MRILILRTSAMGDVVHALPVLAALRREIPDARIGWVVERPFAPLLEGYDEIEHVFPVELRRWRRQIGQGWREGTSARRAIEEFEPEVTLDLMGNHKAGAIAAVVRSPRVIGLRREDRREPSSAMWLTDSVPARGTHAVDRMLSVLAGLGIDPSSADFQPHKLLPTGSDSPPPPEEFFVVQVSAGWINKSYPSDSWGEAARLLSQRTGLSGYVACGPNDREAAEAARAASQGALRDIVPLGLANLAAWLRQAQLMLGADTGAAHLAHALGTPTLMLMGPTDPRRHGPYGHPERTLGIELSCRSCYRRFQTTQTCLDRLDPDAVARRATALQCGETLTELDAVLRLSSIHLPTCG